MPERDEQRVSQFVQHFGALMQASGMPGISAHVFALLLADEDARMTAAEIGQALGVSPAAVSTATSYLATIGMTRKVREPGSRRVVHALVSDDWYATMIAKNNVVAATHALLEEGARAAGGPATPSGRRLHLNAAMFAHLGQALQHALSGWDERKAAVLAELPPLE